MQPFSKQATWRAIVNVGLATALVISTVTLSACFSPNPARKNGEFPNMPVLMDIPTAELDEKFEQLNLGDRDGNEAIDGLEDLNGWHGYDEVHIQDYLDSGELWIYLNDEAQGEDTSYTMLMNGMVYTKDPYQYRDAPYIGNITANPDYFERLFSEYLEPVWDTPGKDIIYELLEACGIDKADIANEEERRFEASPFEIILKLLDGRIKNASDNSAVGTAGTVLEITGETKTQSEDPLYFQASLGCFTSIFEMDASSYSLAYLQIFSTPRKVLYIQFQTNGPFSPSNGPWLEQGMTETGNSVSQDSDTLTESAPRLSVYTTTGEQLTGKVRQDANGYVLPDSSKREYSRSELEAMNLTPAELCIAWNEPFAREGYHFKNKDIQAYFENTTWYRDRNAQVNLTGAAAANNSLLREIAETTVDGSKWKDLATE